LIGVIAHMTGKADYSAHIRMVFGKCVEALTRIKGFCVDEYHFA